MTDDNNSLAIALFSEVLAADQMLRIRLSRVLPKGMEISHFSVLNHLAWHEGERTPAQLAETFHVTRGTDDDLGQMFGVRPGMHMRVCDEQGPVFEDHHAQRTDRV